jgi:putative endonuclease
VPIMLCIIEHPRWQEPSGLCLWFIVFMFYCYILESLYDGRYYVGSTDEVLVRLRQHNKGSVRSTKPYLPWRLIYKESFVARAEALKREKQIKLWKKRASIEKLISKDNN